MGVAPGSSLSGSGVYNLVFVMVRDMYYLFNYQIMLQIHSNTILDLRGIFTDFKLFVSGGLSGVGCVTYLFIS